MPTTADHTFCPYKGLQPYTEADRRYFFGRTRDEGIIISNLYASSVTVFYGASGVGKSSVLLAGAVPRLRQEPRDAVVVVFNTWQSEDFLSALKNEIAKQANLSAPIDTALPLDEFLLQTQRALDLPLLLIFDQFEEYFLYHPPSPPAEAFESAFARVVNRRGTQVNFFLSLREDGLSKLDRFKSRVPTLMNNLLRLEHLDREAAKLAITQPLEEYNRVSGQPPMTIEPSLVRAILNDLQGASAGAEQLGQGVARTSAEGSTAPIETPFLQMVMTRLWDEERAAGSTTLRTQTFETLGRAVTIARTHLDTMMARLTDGERDMAASILRYMVTPSGSKIAQEAGALASWTDLTEAQVQSILTRLSGPDMRILRTMQAPGQPVLYEIFHDVLAGAILDWRARYVSEQKRLEAEKQLEIERAKASHRLAKQRLRTRRLGLVAVGLLLATGAMVYLAYKAYQAKFLANSSSLVASSRALLNTDPELSLLLAIRAVETKPTQKAVDALKAALLQSHVSAVMRGHTGEVKDVAFSPDGVYLVTASWDKTARVWKAATGELVSVLPAHTNKVNSASFSRDARYIVTAGFDNHAYVWEGWQTATTPHVVATLSEEKPIWTTAFSPDGDYILTGGDGEEVNVWEWKKDVITPKAKLRIAEVTSALGSAATPSPMPTPVSTATPAPDSSPSASPGPSPSPTPQPGHLKNIYRAAFSKDGRYIIIAAWSRTTLIWEWKKEKDKDNPVRLGEHNAVVLAAALSDSADYAATGSDDKHAAVWEWRKDRTKRQSDLNLVPYSVRGVAFSPDANIVATASDDSVVRLWDWHSQKFTFLRGHRGIVFCVAYNPGGNFLVSGGEDKTARVWRTEKLDQGTVATLSLNALLELARKRVTRHELTAQEKQRYYLDD